MTYSDALLRDVLARTRRIACVGISPDPLRPSYFVGRYLSLRGFEVYPVNPVRAGATLFGSEVFATLEDIPADVEIDMVDIFRRPEHVPVIVEAALARFPRLRTIWMQIGVKHAEAAALAEARGVTVIQDRCPKMEYQRLYGELRKAGIATGVISSKL